MSHHNKKFTYFLTIRRKIEQRTSKHWLFFCSDCYLVNQSDFSTNVSLQKNWTGNATMIPASVLSFESTTLWPITTINCITLAFVFSKGKPFRKPIYTNCKYVKFIFYLFSIVYFFNYFPLSLEKQVWNECLRCNSCITLK